MRTALAQLLPLGRAAWAALTVLLQQGRQGAARQRRRLSEQGNGPRGLVDRLGSRLLSLAHRRLASSSSSRVVSAEEPFSDRLEGMALEESPVVAPSLGRATSPRERLCGLTAPPDLGMQDTAWQDLADPLPEAASLDPADHPAAALTTATDPDWGKPRRRYSTPLETPPDLAPILRQRRALTINPVLRQALEQGRSRLMAVTVVFCVAFSLVGLRLVDVTLWTDPKARWSSQGSTSHKPDRAEITDRNGILLATTLTTPSLFANPRKIRDPERVLFKLMFVLPELDADTILARLQSDRAFVWIKRNITPSQQEAINCLGIPGLNFRYERRRIYPQGVQAAHLLGFTNVDNDGLAGIEKTFNSVLREVGDPLVLSIDLRVQHVVRDELRQAMERFQAIGGAGVVMDVNTGEVVAMASLPDFDANNPGNASEEARLDRAAYGVYELGSIFKIFTTAMALDSGRIALWDRFDASEPIKSGRFTIRDFHGQDRLLNLPEIFKYSSNIGAAKMAMALGTPLQQLYLERFGLLASSPIELPARGDPLVPSVWRDINTMTIAFGHGIAVTPLNLATAVAAMVNGGVLYPPTLLHRSEGDFNLGERVISEEVSATMRKLMYLSTIDGTGRKAAAPGYVVGGKTGTAEKSKDGRYVEDALISSFVAAFPMQEPRYVVFVMLDEPKGNEETHGMATGGWVAAPTVGSIIARIGPLLQVAPVDPNDPALRASLALGPAPDQPRPPKGQQEQPVVGGDGPSLPHLGPSTANAWDWQDFGRHQGVQIGAIE